MSRYSIELQGRELVAEGTMAFHFSKPAGFEFSAGQALELLLSEPVAGEPSGYTQHTFSIVSAPHEPVLTVATRMRNSVYKNRLQALAPGSEVQIEGPSGSLVLHNELQRPAVMIAGGIGITPFISMLREAAKQQRQQELLLLYSNKTPEGAAYLSELVQLAEHNPHFKLIALMTRAQESAQAWQGATGHLTAARIGELCGHLKQPIYYISGPPLLVENMRDVLESAGVDEMDIHSEGFTGY